MAKKRKELDTSLVMRKTPLIRRLKENFILRLSQTTKDKNTKEPREQIVASRICPTCGETYPLLDPQWEDDRWWYIHKHNCKGENDTQET